MYNTIHFHNPIHMAKLPGTHISDHLSTLWWSTHTRWHDCLDSAAPSSLPPIVHGDIVTWGPHSGNKSLISFAQLVFVAGCRWVRGQVPRGSLECILIWENQCSNRVLGAIGKHRICIAKVDLGKFTARGVLSNGTLQLGEGFGKVVEMSEHQHALGALSWPSRVLVGVIHKASGFESHIGYHAGLLPKGLKSVGGEGIIESLCRNLSVGTFTATTMTGASFGCCSKDLGGSDIPNLNGCVEGATAEAADGWIGVTNAGGGGKTKEHGAQ